MREIKRLVQIIQRLSGKKILQVFEYVAVTENSPVIYQKLLAKIQHGKINNDDEAAAALYKGADSEDQRYRMVKSRTRSKLNNMVLFWAIEGVAADPEAECMAFLSRAKIFLNEHEYELAEKQSRKAIEIARNGEITELILVGLRMLRTIYSSLQRPNRLRKIVSEIAEYEELYKAEEKAAKIYYLQSYKINKSERSRVLHLQETTDQLEKLHQLWLMTNSSNVFVKEFDLRVSYYMYSHQYKVLLEYCQKTEALLAKRKINTLRFNFAHLYHALTLSFLKAKSYEEALNYPKTGFKHIGISEREGLAFHEIYFICALRAKKWEAAEERYTEVLKNLNGARRKEDVLKWKVLYNYLQLYTDDTGGRASRDFDDMVKSATDLDADSSLIIRLYILKMIDLFKSDRINEFLSMYPQIDSLFRSYHSDDAVEADRLLRLANFLYQLITVNFDPSAVKMKTTYILRGLKIQYDPYSDTEVIPFDEVVDFIISHFDKAHQELRFGKQ